MRQLPPLSPHRREVLLDALRPPSGHQLDCAVGTCFSLDLMSALLVPMALAVFDTEQSDEKADPIALLAATQAYASDLSLYCEQGRIGPAVKAPNVVGYLEDSLKPVAPPSAGCFHPKLWVLRYGANDGSGTRHRVLCMSRNLTFDRSWDSILRLEEGEGSPNQTRPLRDFLDYLQRLAPSTHARSISESLREVAFEPPHGFRSINFEPLLPGHSGDPIGEGEELLIVSPFVSQSRVEHLASRWHKVVLASRGESLDRIADAETMGRLKQVYVFDTLDTDGYSTSPADEALAESVGLQGLHAKLFAGKEGKSSFLVTGSANATNAAFENNVEFCVRLEADNTSVAPQKLLATRPDNAGLRALLREYEPPDEPAETTEEELELERLESLRREIADVALVVRCRPAEDGTYMVTLHGESVLPDLEESDRLKCWPVTLPESHAQEPEGAPLASWEIRSIVNVTALIAFELAGRRGVPPLRFTLKAKLEGDIEDRLDAILSDTLDNPQRLMQFLLLLLATGGDEHAGALGNGSSGLGTRRPLGTEMPIEIPLLETLMRTYAREPGRLRAFQRTLARLEQARKRGHPLPPDLLEIWKPVEVALGQRAVEEAPK